LRKGLQLLDWGAQVVEGVLTTDNAASSAKALIRGICDSTETRVKDGGPALLASAGGLRGRNAASSSRAKGGRVVDAILESVARENQGRTGVGGPTIGSSTAQGPTFRDLVEATANSKGVVFLPHTKRSPVDGCPVYRMGPLAVYIDAGVLFVDRGSGGVYEPMSIDDALAICE